MKRISTILTSGVVFGSLLSSVMLGSVSAHVVVRPAEVLTGSYQTFSVGVPNERTDATVVVKVLIPDTVKSVTPTVKQGWNIAVEKTGSGEDAVVKSVTWSNGAIPAGQRDDFTFSAKVPDKDAKLEWKAYQTYQDGTEVAWDSAEEHEDEKEDSNKGPMSITDVVTTTADDAALEDKLAVVTSTKRKADTAYVLSIFTLVVSLILVARSRKSSK